MIKRFIRANTDKFCSMACEEAGEQCDLCIAQKRYRDDQKNRAEGRKRETLPEHTEYRRQRVDESYKVRIVNLMNRLRRMRMRPV